MTSDYQRWLAWIDAFRAGADVAPDHLDPMAGMVGVEALNRVAIHAEEALSGRLDRWTKSLQRDLLAVQSGPAAHALASAERVLVGARRSLEPLARFAASDLLLDQLRQALSAQLADAVVRFHESAVADVRRNGRRDESFLRLLLRVPLLPAIERGLAPAAGPRSPSSGRRVVLLPGTSGR